MRIYDHRGTALLRAAVRTRSGLPGWWPDPRDTQACITWLGQLSSNDILFSIEQASPSLATAIRRINDGERAKPKRVRGAAISAAGYLLRCTGRPTPFGTFAGVAPVRIGDHAAAGWGDRHRLAVRPDTEWLASVTGRLERDPDVFRQLQVVFNDLAAPAGGWIEFASATGITRVRDTPVLQQVRELASGPIVAGDLASKIAPDHDAVLAMLMRLAEESLLITALRAPSTVTDVLGHIIETIGSLGAIPPEIRAVTGHLRDIHSAIHEPRGEQPGAGHELDSIQTRMRAQTGQHRPVLAADMVLDCEVAVPASMVTEACRAADVLLRLSRHRTGLPRWQHYHQAFTARYGTGAAIPVTEVLHAGTGLGYAAGYPGSSFADPPDPPRDRDRKLAELAWAAVARGAAELVLTDDMITHLTDGWVPAPGQIPPHVEIAVQVQAASAAAIDQGRYVLIVSPARAGGVLTSRFTPTATGAGLEEAYRALPAGTAGAITAQMSFPPSYPHAENVARVPAYLPDLLPLGEHRSDTEGLIRLADLAITATPDRLWLVTRQDLRVVEPQVFHALNLDKQPPLTARFLASLHRGFCASWTAFDWGPHAGFLPYLPRVRYRRSVLSVARWQLTPDEAAATQAWREPRQLPRHVALKEDDRTLPLDLEEPMHAAILTKAIARQGQAVVTEQAAGNGWIGGHAHEIAIPLAAATPPARHLRPATLTTSHAQVPSGQAHWLYMKIFAPAAWHDELLTRFLPALLADLGEPQRFWFVRYRDQHETDHLRLRLHCKDAGGFTRCASLAGAWARHLRDDGMTGRAVMDTYFPETGRYGGAGALPAAENVFAADSRMVLALLLAGGQPHGAVTATGMLQIAVAMMGEGTAFSWLAATPEKTIKPPDQIAAAEVSHLARTSTVLAPPGCPPPVLPLLASLTQAIGAYRAALPADADIPAITRSLMHMHYNRLAGIDPDHEQTCRYLIWRAASTASAGVLA